MKIATWSVNGVNRRLRYLQHWLRKRQPDVVALQKIRVSAKRRGNLPRKAIEEVGYRVEELLADHELASAPTAANTPRSDVAGCVHARVQDPDDEDAGLVLPVEDDMRAVLEAAQTRCQTFCASP